MIKGKLFCITGSLENFSLKKAAYEDILHHGGNITNRITNTCNFLILGAKGNPNYAQGKKGNKQLKAEKWAEQGFPIRIISENQFIALLEESEELSAEKWGEDLNSPTVQTFKIERSSQNGLEISTSFWPPQKGVLQVLRIKFASAETDESIIEKWYEPLQKIKAILSESGMKNQIRTETIPAGWARSGKGLFLPGRVILSCRIIALLDTIEHKDKSLEITKATTNLLIENNMEGNLSLRIWDDTYRYGKYWINKLI